jgi:uncharacterized protein YecE (DUF72 family)
LQQSLDFFDPEVSLKDKLAADLQSLAALGLFVGGSSWKYEGWLGSIYSPARYRIKGRFSQKRFEQECLAEYAETFPIVCGDFAFYQFPSKAFWQKLFAQAAPPFQFAFKAPEELTLPKFPKQARHGARGGTLNPGFLNADLFRTQFLDLLLPYKEQVALILFEFGAAIEKHFEDAAAFAERLAVFLGALPRGFRFAVEIRTPGFLDEAYFTALRETGVAHVLNSWTAMPELSEQIARPDCFPADFTVARALLRAGRSYEDAVNLFAPYSEIRDRNDAVRQALRDLLVRAKRRAEPTFVFVNNRLEGFAPGTIAAVVDGL